MEIDAPTIIAAFVAMGAAVAVVFAFAREGWKRKNGNGTGDIPKRLDRIEEVLGRTDDRGQVLVYGDPSKLEAHAADSRERFLRVEERLRSIEEIERSVQDELRRVRVELQAHMSWELRKYENLTRKEDEK